MGYGKDSMYSGLVNRTRAIFNSATREVEDPVWKKEMALPETMAPATADVVNQRKNAILEKLSKEMSENSLDSYLDSSAVIRRSAWLNKVHVPTKKEIDDEMNKARIKTDVASLSQSQRTKRGEKFNEKAERQAKAVRELNLLKKGRDVALESILNSNLPAGAQAYDADQIDGYLNDLDHLDGTGNMISDIAFYAQWRDYSETKSGQNTSARFFFDRLPKEKKKKDKVSHQKRVMNMLDSESYGKECIHMLLEMADLNLDIFNYANDADFIKNYSCRMATLKAFSHSKEMRLAVSQNKELEDEYNELIKPIYNKLAIKSSIIDSIIEDYEMRIKMIRSPYYALLASKDIDKMSVDELQARANNALEAGDMVVAEYLDAMLDKREKTGNVLFVFEKFSKGTRASDIEKRAMKKMGKISDAAKKEEKKEAKKEEKVRKAEKKKEDALEKAEEAVLMAQEHEMVKNTMTNFIDNLGDDYTRIKNTNKKIKESDAIVMTLEKRADRHTADFERDKVLHRNYPLRQLKNLPMDYTAFLTGCTDSEKKAIRWLNDRLAFSGMEKTGNLNENIPDLDAKLEAYYDRLILLVRTGERIGEATQSVTNPGVDFELLEGNYKYNKNFTKAELSQHKAIQDGIKNFKNKIINSKEHKELCDAIKANALEICNDLMIAYSKEMTEDEALQKLGPAMSLVMKNARYDYDEDVKKASGSIYVRKMPRVLPEEADRANKLFLGKKTDKKSKEGYPENGMKIEQYMRAMDRYYDNKEEERASYSDIKGAGDLFDEYACLPFMDTKDRKQFIKASVAISGKSFSKMNKKDAAAFRKGMEQVFDHLLKLNLDSLAFKNDEEMFNKFSELKGFADIGVVLGKMIKKYKKAGGILGAEEQSRLSAMGDTLYGIWKYIDVKSIMAVNPDWAYTDHNKLLKLSEDKLREISLDQHHLTYAHDRKIAELEREQMSLKQKKEGYVKARNKAVLNIDKSPALANKLGIEDDQPAVDSVMQDAEKKMEEINAQILKNDLMLEEIRKEKKEALMHSDLAERLVLLKALEKESVETECYHVTEATPLKTAYTFNKTVYGRNESYVIWEGVAREYAASKEKINKNLWPSNSIADHTIDNLYYLGEKKCFLSELSDKIKITEFKTKEINKDNVSVALQGLLIQFKNVERDGEKCAFKQFKPLGMPLSKDEAAGLGAAIAMYEPILTYARDLDKLFADKEYIRKEVLESLGEADLALYKEIIGFSNSFLPMIEDFNRLMTDEKLSDENAEQIRMAMETYLQTLFVADQQNGEIDAKTWTMPSKTGDYKDFFDAVADDKAMETLKKKYYAKIK